MGIEIDKKNKRSKDKADKKISIALMSSFVILTIQYFVLIYFNLVGSSTASLVQMVSKALVGIAFLYAIPVVINRSKTKLIGVYFITIFIFVLNYTFFTNNRMYLEEVLFPVFFMSLPAFIYSLSINNLLVFKGYMKKASYIVFCFGALLGILIFTGRASAGTYSMSLSYYMLLPTIMFIDELFDKLSFIVIFLTMISLLVILALGSRGAILCILIFVVLKFLRQNSKRTFKRILRDFSLLGIGIILFLFLNEILESIYILLLKFGINSRTLTLFLIEEVHLSGRDSIYNDVIAKLLDNPMTGIGLVGDREVLNGTYAHNFFIEVLSNFGIITGTIILVSILVLLLKGLVNKEKNVYSLIFIWVSLGFVHLMVSGSYLIDIKFWILMGLLINSSTGKYSRINNQI